MQIKSYTFSTLNLVFEMALGQKIDNNFSNYLFQNIINAKSFYTLLY